MPVVLLNSLIKLPADSPIKNLIKFMHSNLIGRYGVIIEYPRCELCETCRSVAYIESVGKGIGASGSIQFAGFVHQTVFFKYIFELA